MEALSDDELIKIYKKKENNCQKAFEILLERHKKPVYSFIYKMVENKSVAEDLFQEVFIKFINSIDSYREEKKFKSWIFKIANNLTIDYIRKIKRRKISSIEEEIVKKKDRAIKLEDTLKSYKPLPLEIIEKKERNKILKEAILELTLEQKEVFLLRHESDLSFKEIAELMKCPLNTALGRMNIAIKKIKKKLEELIL